MQPFVADPDFKLYVGDVREVLAQLPAESVDCVVTSPPYWGLRDYGTDGQIGLEATPELFVAEMVAVFREVRRVLAPHGTLWLNLGDSYARTGGDGAHGPNALVGNTKSGQARRMMKLPEAALGVQGLATDEPAFAESWRVASGNIKEKDLCGIPWRVAFALQADGWYLRADIIWSKPNPMPESVTDRPTKAHEYVFMLSKQPRYFFDAEAVREEYAPKTLTHRGGGKAAGKVGQQDGVGKVASGNFGEWDKPRTAYPPPRPQNETLDGSDGEAPRGPDGRRATNVKGADGSIQHRDGERWPNGGRNLRSVWEIATQPYAEAHFATYPEALVERCLSAGCPEQVCATCGKPRERIVAKPGGSYHDHEHDLERGQSQNGSARKQQYVENLAKPRGTIGWNDCGHGNYRVGVVLDPFMGSGTTARVARRLGRHAVGVELNPEYAALCARRLQQLSLLADDGAAA